MENRKKELAITAQKVMGWHHGRIQFMKQRESDLQRDDFVWHYLLQSFSTMGRSAGWFGLIGTPENYKAVGYEYLQSIPKRSRLAHLKNICRKAKVRMPDKKAGFIAACFIKLEAEGGYLQAKHHLLAQEGTKAKIKYLKSFPGIGEKYARNMMMDVYHPDFRDSIAVDIRIKSILSELDVGLRTYAEQEAFLLDVARLAGLNGWELDRLMYGYLDEFLVELRFQKNQI
jgi:hypothetical protein